jgi:hypothetical protein
MSVELNDALAALGVFLRIPAGGADERPDGRVLLLQPDLIQAEVVGGLGLVHHDNDRNLLPAPVADRPHPVVQHGLGVAGVLSAGLQHDEVQRSGGQEEPVGLVEYLLAAEIPDVQPQWVLRQRCPSPRPTWRR